MLDKCGYRIGVLYMRQKFIEFWHNNQVQNQKELYDNATSFLIKNSGIKLIGKGTKDIVFSIWDFEGVLLYIELCGADCEYRFLN